MMRRSQHTHYSSANLRSLGKFCTRLAELGRNVDVDLWGYETEGRSIKKAIDYLLPYAQGRKKWNHTQIVSFNPEKLLTALLQAAPYDDSGRYASAARDLMSEDTVERLLNG